MRCVFLHKNDSSANWTHHTQMVLDAGRLVEFDSPKALLKKEGSLLRALVDESVDKDILYDMAEGKVSAVTALPSSSSTQ